MSANWMKLAVVLSFSGSLSACSDPAEPQLPDPMETDFSPSIGVLLQRVERARFVSNIEQLASFGDRQEGTQSNIDAGNWIEEQLSSYGYQVTRHTFTYRGGLADNLYVTKVGSTHPDSMYIVSAHFDGRGGGGAADDDASGTSLVMEIARVIAGADVRTERSVRMILWNNEEVGLIGARAYVEDRAALQGVEDPPGSGLFPEPAWLGMIQHDMILFDHGLPPQPQQSPQADVDVEFQLQSGYAGHSATLAALFPEAREAFSIQYPVEVGNNMRSTDSWAFMDHTASVSVRENRRVDEIGEGSNPHWHQPSDLFETFSEADFDLGLATVQTTLAVVAHLAGITVLP